MLKIYTTNKVIKELLVNYFDFTNNLVDCDMILLSEDALIDDNHIIFFKIKKRPILGISKRINKIQQNVLLKTFDINTPKSFYTKNLESISTPYLLDGLVDLPEYIIKPIDGARGIGVIKIKREAHKKMLFNAKSENVDYVKSEFIKEIDYIKNQHDVNIYDPEAYLIDSIVYFGIIQEIIDVSREFRILLSINDFIGYERIKKEGELIANLSNGATSKIIDDKTLTKITPTLEKMRDLMKYINYPYLSMDMYIDKNGDIGIFEFQMEFDYQGFDYKKVQEFLVRTINEEYKWKLNS